MTHNFSSLTLPGMALLMVLATSCSDSAPMVSLGVDDAYIVSRMQKLALEPAFTGNGYEWTLRHPDGTEETVSLERSYVFMQAEEGEYLLRFEVKDDDSPYLHECHITVRHEEVEYSPYISRVYEYCPAPGQFVNEMPMYEDGDTYADMLQKAEESISGTNDIMISLGSYGGYVTFGFDHTVVNIPGKPDFRIWGNAFYELTQPDKKGGSAEPGIVMVSYDANCNGIPDDPWYELAGSEYYKPATLHGYSITYSRPDPSAAPEEDESGMLSDIRYIPWTDSEGKSGYVAKNIFHTQDYYPRWIDADALTFSGSLLAPNAADLSGTGTYYVLYCYDYGYVDNHPNDYADLNSFDISLAVDADGNPVYLPGADFIRVYTGVNQYCGWLGETSTEICRAQDLHISTGTSIPSDPMPES